jgi:hypothetical protein
MARLIGQRIFKSTLAVKRLAELVMTNVEKKMGDLTFSDVVREVSNTIKIRIGVLIQISLRE